MTIPDQDWLHDWKTISGLHIDSIELIQGGDTHQAFRLWCGDDTYFLKISRHHDGEAMLAAEEQGLSYLGDRGLTVPLVHKRGRTTGISWLLTEWLPSTSASAVHEEDAARQLAAFHRLQEPASGDHADNYIGSLPQVNTPCDSWVEFFAERRIGDQVRMASHKGLLDTSMRRKFDRLIQRLDALLPARASSPLHGDLWNGNWLALADGSAAFIDPAVYAGDREIDLAMTRLFGGFGQVFYSTYETVYPMELGWEDRLLIYQSYYLLVHLNLFGPSWLPRLEPVIRRYG